MVKDIDDDELVES